MGTVTEELWKPGGDTARGRWQGLRRVRVTGKAWARGCNPQWGRGARDRGRTEMMGVGWERVGPDADECEVWSFAEPGVGNITFAIDGKSHLGQSNVKLWKGGDLNFVVDEGKDLE